MRKFKSDNKDINVITFKGVKYFFIVDDNGIGIRRKDKQDPSANEVEALTEYLFDEGWSRRRDFEEQEEWKD
jgi:hypothetical protein